MAAKKTVAPAAKEVKTIKNKTVPAPSSVRRLADYGEAKKKIVAKPIQKNAKVKVITVKEKKIPALKKSTAVKAAPVRKQASHGMLKKELIFAPAEVCFWVNNGHALQSLLDLREAFKTLTAEQYSYHSNKEKNDFSAWTLHILKDEKCAKDLLKAKTTKAALKVVEEHLKEYAV
jgi:hypothetical protein